MNLNNIPAISLSNNHAYTYRLTQLNYADSQKQYQSKNNNFSYNQGRMSIKYDIQQNNDLLTKSLVASDNDYTKKDAILHQWNLEGRFNIYDVMNGNATVKLQDPNPSDEVLQEFEKKLQTNGIQKDMDWSSLSFDMRGIGFDSNANPNSIKENDFTRKVNYIASRYAAVEYKIKNTTSGEQQTEQLKKLQEVYQNAVNEIADGYTNIVCSFLENNDVEGEREKIHQSILNGVESKINEYRKSITNNDTLKSLEGTEDSWLLDDDAYVAAVLRETDTTQQQQYTENNTDNHADYTLHDLENLGQYVSSLYDMENSFSVFQMDESRIGIDFAMLTMKTDVLQNKGGISKNMAKTIQKIMEGFKENLLNRMDKQLSEKRYEGNVADAQMGFAALNRNIIWNVYDKAMQQYQKSGNVIQALTEGAKYGSQIAKSQYTNGTYRCKNSASYWDSFFEKNTENANAYKDNDTTLQKYLAGWKDFENSLNKSVHLNMKLQSVQQYHIAKSNVISKKV